MSVMYITAQEIEELFPHGAPDPLPVKLKRHQGDLWLADRKRGKLIAPGNRRLQSLGLYSLNLRGWKNYEARIRRALLRPADEVELIREPSNPYDANAVYVSAPKAPGVLGYINKGLAKRVTKLLEAGTVLEARVLRCPPSSFQFSVVFGSPEKMSDLLA